MTDDIFVYLVPGLPVPEAVTPCDGGYTIYISADLCRETQREKLDHAMTHIVRRDFERSSADQVEADARKKRNPDKPG